MRANWLMHPAGIFALWLVLLAAVLIVPHFTSLPGEHATRRTVDLALAYWAVALCGMLRFAPADWTAQTALGAGVRWLWTWAWVTFVIHVAVAMHYYHHWSHEHAIEHTRAASGFGEGIYLSHLFTILWGVDVMWWQSSPASYARRPGWLGCGLHGFMLFMGFNGAVVYETGPIRWVALAGFVLLGVAWFWARTARSEVGGFDVTA